MKYLATLIAAAGLMLAQHAANAKSHAFKGKVTEVGKDKLTVQHGDIPGYMGGMTMGYKVDKPDVLKQAKAGDEVEATVYDDDYTLYNVKLVPPAKGKAK